MSTRVQIYKVRLVRDHVGTYPADYFDDPRDAAIFFERLIGKADREHFAALFLDSNHAPMGASIVGIGTIASVKVHARELFKAAILANAESIIISHNHPASGSSVPSTGDISATRALQAAGELLGITVRDHIIVCPGGTFTSMRDVGLMRAA